MLSLICLYLSLLSFLSILGGFQIGDPFRKKQMQGIGFGGRFFFLNPLLTTYVTYHGLLFVLEK